MTPDADGLTNYRECSRPLGLANGEEISIVGYGDLTVSFCTDHGWIRVEMNDVAHVPQLSYNLISLPSMTQKGHTYTGDKDGVTGDKDGVTLKLKGGETVFFPLVGKLCRQYGYRPEAAGSMVGTACATIAPGKAKAPTNSQHSPLHVRPHSRGTTQKDGDTAKDRLQRGTSRVPGMFDGKGAAEAHREVDAHQSR